MQIILFLLSFIVVTTIYANNTCKVDDLIMYNIASIEAHKDLPVGYPYVISINNKIDSRKLQKDPILKDLFIDTRTINCLDQKTCTLALKYLIAQNINNIDCGAFQLNYKYWKMSNMQDYFNLFKSYQKACEIVMYHNKDEWSWENIAKYHSKTKYYNEKYRDNLLSRLEKTLNY